MKRLLGNKSNISVGVLRHSKGCSGEFRSPGILRPVTGCLLSLHSLEKLGKENFSDGAHYAGRRVLKTSFDPAALLLHSSRPESQLLNELPLTVFM
jgi:hypothetical protein